MVILALPDHLVGGGQQRFRDAGTSTNQVHVETGHPFQALHVSSTICRHAASTAGGGSANC
jgi:hypothetical protein